MKRFVKNLTAVCIAVLFAVQTAFPVFAAEPEEAVSECAGYFTAQRGADSFWDGLEYGWADWAAYCMARLNGGTAPEYVRSAEEKVAELAQSEGFVKPTELQRAGIFLAALGGEYEQAVLLGSFMNEQLDRQGFNAYIWALIAVNVTGMQPPEGAVNTADSLVDYIISQQHADGSFALFGDAGDVDITAAAVYALCGTDIPAAQEAAQHGADWLCAIEGGYTSMGARNCESTAQAVIALCAAGRSEKAQEAAEMLEEYRREGGYAHLPDGDINGMATAQAMEAFTALILAGRGEALFGRIAPEEAAGSPEAVAETGDNSEKPDSREDPAPEEENGQEPSGAGLTGEKIKLVLSIALGAGAAAAVVVLVLRRKKLAAVLAVVLAAAAGGVWLLDIRTPEEYYSQSRTGDMRVTVSAECTSVLDRMDSIDPAVNPAEVVPEDGLVIRECTVELPEGASAFDALTAASRAQRVRVDYTGSSYGTYVKGIGYIYEFGFGDLSGWMYRVNGEFPDVSASSFVLEEGDVVEFLYTCDLGRDVGDVYTAEG